MRSCRNPTMSQAKGDLGPLQRSANSRMDPGPLHGTFSTHNDIFGHRFSRLSQIVSSSAPAALPPSAQLAVQRPVVALALEQGPPAPPGLPASPQYPTNLSATALPARSSLLPAPVVPQQLQLRPCATMLPAPFALPPAAARWGPAPSPAPAQDQPAPRHRGGLTCDSATANYGGWCSD